ncbi:unnamed protein product [Peniophora sp. CBMAI 1063]|nr:unnamed protein product [Peniophora sp. CBMAI 1063]
MVHTCNSKASADTSQAVPVPKAVVAKPAATAAASKSPAASSHKCALSGPNESSQPAKKKQPVTAEESSSEDEFVHAPPQIQRPKKCITADSTDDEDEPMPEVKDDDDEEVPVENDEFELDTEQPGSSKTLSTEAPEPGRTKTYLKLKKLLGNAKADKVGTSLVLRPGGKEPPKRPLVPVEWYRQKMHEKKAFVSSSEDEAEGAVANKSASAPAVSKGKVREVVQPDAKSDGNIVQASKDEEDEEDVPLPVQKPKCKLPPLWTVNETKVPSNSVSTKITGGTPKVSATPKIKAAPAVIKKTTPDVKIAAVRQPLKLKVPKKRKPDYIEIHDFSNEADKDAGDNNDDKPVVQSPKVVTQIKTQKQEQYEILVSFEEFWGPELRLT